MGKNISTAPRHTLEKAVANLAVAETSGDLLRGTTASGWAAALMAGNWLSVKAMGWTLASEYRLAEEDRL